MTRTNQNFSMYSGDSKMVYFNVKDRFGEHVNLAGYNISWVVKQRGSTVIMKSITSGISIVDASKGRLLVRINPEDTANISGDCQYQLRAISPDGIASTVSTGIIHVEVSLH